MYDSRAMPVIVNFCWSDRWSWDWFDHLRAVRDDAFAEQISYFEYRHRTEEFHGVESFVCFHELFDWQPTINDILYHKTVNVEVLSESSAYYIEYKFDLFF